MKSAPDGGERLAFRGLDQAILAEASGARRMEGFIRMNALMRMHSLPHPRKKGQGCWK
jgi:hypothetical protein